MSTSKPTLPPELQQALQRGDVLSAMKALRGISGMDLQAAKRAFEQQVRTQVQQQADAGFSKAVEYAGESGVQVQKRTDIGHGMDIDSGCLTVKQKISKKFSKKQKKNQAGSA